ncbi:hypothetical protein RND81_02G241000 [Saponaria officinalis]|uniref:PB1 domain-containing protein n=1 Tax=Saponaria officinalis TaxID=3572 RepID=A0AAW1MZ98_SAPOF
MGRPSIEFTNTVKFLCSYGGKILPRFTDAKLRYHGGHTRVLSVPRSISFPELMTKMGELCGTTVSIRCQLPTEDLDALITIKSDEDLANLIEEYDRVFPTSSTKIRAFLFTPKSPLPKLTTTTTAAATLSPPSSESPNSLSPNSLSPSSSFNFSATASASSPSPPPPSPAYYSKFVSRKSVHHHQLQQRQQIYGCERCCRNLNRVYLIHNGNHWHI